MSQLWSLRNPGEKNRQQHVNSPEKTHESARFVFVSARLEAAVTANHIRHQHNLILTHIHQLC